MERDQVLKNKYALQGADLQRADLLGANLLGADLRRANLLGADLREANLRGANLREADLRRANLQGADLQGADLLNISINYLTVGVQNAPQGTLTVWKKCKDGILIKLCVPTEAKRSCATTRKCRSEFVDVLEAPPCGAITIFQEKITKYIQGERVYPDSWDEDRWNECSHGIHWFLTQEEAIGWGQ